MSAVQQIRALSLGKRAVSIEWIPSHGKFGDVYYDGERDGDRDGERDGDRDGERDGDRDGECDGESDGERDGERDNIVKLSVTI